MNGNGLQIAVVGLGSILPGSLDPQGFWANVVAGRDLMRDIPAERWLIADHYSEDPFAPDKTYARRGAFLDGLEFDPLAFGIPPKTISAIDAAQLLALVAAKQTFQDAAAGRPSWLDGLRERTSVLLGAAALELMAQMAARTQHPVWRKALRDKGVEEQRVQEIVEHISAHYVPWQVASFPGALTNVVAGRIANRLDLHGTNCTTDAACASSLSAISMGIDELVLGRADLVLAGGVDLTSGPTTYIHFSKTPALSRTGACRPFSDRADGTMLGEGLAMVALRRLADAEEAGDRIYAVIEGIGSSSDGQGGAIYAPQVAGQARALHRAYASAGYGPDTVGLVEAHGTGTPAGDATEFQALSEVFAATGRSVPQWCALGSVKSQIGHTKCASGAVGLLKTVLALHQKVLPPTINVDRPDPALSIENSPFYLNTKTRPWVHAADTPRRAALSSFGFGGSNFHLTAQEYRGANSAPRLRAVPSELVLFSGTTRDALFAALAGRHGTPDQAPPETTLAALARESQETFDPCAAWRMAIVAASRTDLSAKWQHARAAAGDSYRAPGVRLSGKSPSQGKVAFLFPGQGSQYPSMSADIAMHLPQVMRLWEHLGTQTWDGLALHEVVFPRPGFTKADDEAHTARLAATEWAQPALAVHSLALLGLLLELGLRPDAVAGHSFGELVALHAAGVYDAEALLQLARRRGEAMRDAARATPGAMLALACSQQAARPLLSGQAWLVNINAPEQVVVSGSADAINEVAKLAGAKGIASRLLPTSAAFHSPLVSRAQEPITRHLSTMDIKPPRLAVYGNADAQPYPAEQEAVRERIASQLSQPVLFQAQIEAMYEAGVRVFVELGAGNVLSGLATQTLTGREHVAVSLDSKGKHGVTGLHDGLAELAVAGLALDFSPLWAPFPVDQPVATEKRRGMSVQITSVNHVQPFTPADSLVAPPPAAKQDEPEGGSRQALELIESVTHRIAEAHATYQATAAESHGRFLQTAQASLTAIAQVSAGGLISGGKTVSDPEPAMPTAPAIAELEPVPVQPVSGPPKESGPDLGLLLLEVIAELTGYPVDMLNQEMDFESDLGLDSIKRVQIVSHVRERVPDFPQIDVADLATLRTASQVVEYFQGRVPRFAGRERQEAAGQDLEGDLPRLVITAVPAVTAGLALPGLTERALYVTDEVPEIAAELVSELTRRGFSAEIAGAVPQGATAVICLAGLAEGKDSPLARKSFEAARSLAKAGSQAGVFVTVQDTGGAFGHRGSSIRRCWHGGPAALARTFAVEHPAAAVKAIDCERGERHPSVIARSIVDELCQGGSDPDVGLRADGTRLVLRASPAAARTSGLPPLDDNSVLVVSGGGRGITAAAVIELARRYRPRMVLLGRSELADEDPSLAGFVNRREVTAELAERARRLTGSWPAPAQMAQDAEKLMASREIRATLTACHAAGATVRYETADVRDVRAVTAALARTREHWGPITGLVHGAGVVTDRALSAEVAEDFEAVYGTKVDGIRALLAATAEDPLALICLFGSVVAFGGSEGQAAYAMANEVMAQLATAHADARPGCRAVTIAWGPWDGGMVGPSVAEYFRNVKHYPLIDTQSGAHAFVSNLRGEETQVIVTPDSQRALDAIAGRFPKRAEIHAGIRSHPQLADHTIAGHTVIPLAYMAEWMQRVAGPLSWHSLNVIRPAVLDGDQTLPLRVEQSGDTLIVSGLDGRPYCRATVTTTCLPPRLAAAPEGLKPHAGEIYDGERLFHGPQFQMIAAIHGVSREAVTATLRGVKDMSWPAEPWHTDVALVDGALQLPAAWAAATGQPPGLPMSIAEMRRSDHSPRSGHVRAVAWLTHAANDHARFDITLSSMDGAPLVQLLGVEYVTRPHRDGVTP